MKKLTRLLITLLAKLLVTLAVMAALVTFSVFMVGAYLLTLPLHRQSPTSARAKAIAQLGTAIVAVIIAVKQTQAQNSNRQSPEDGVD